MTKVKKLVQEIVAQGLFDKHIANLEREVVQEDDCPCCVDSAYPWLNGEARVRAEVEAAFLCAAPAHPLWGAWWVTGA